MLNLGDDLKLPALEAQTQTFVVYGNKGMGKTNFGTVFAEELFRNHLRFSWIDPVGVAWGLKHSVDGKGEGLEVLVLGGVHGDLAIEPTGGEVIADFVVDENVSVVIDISRHATGRMWTRSEKVKFVRDYMQRLYARQGERRRPIMQIIDECGRFAPEISGSIKGQEHILESRAAIEEVCELGRNIGIGVLLITQRSARMAKSVSELAEMMVGFRTTGPNSIASIVKWFGEHIPRPRHNELVERLRKLPKGTPLIVSPGWLDLEGEYAIRARETFDSSDTPIAGQEREPTGEGAKVVDLNAYRERIAATVEKAEADDPKALHREIERLKHQLEQKPPPVVEAADPIEIEVPIEVPILQVDEAEILRGSVETLVKVVQKIESTSKTIEAAVSAASADFSARLERRESDRAKAAKGDISRNAITQKVTRRPAPEQTDVSIEAPKLKKGERHMLAVLADRFPLKSTKPQIAQLAGYTRKSSTTGVYLAKLKRLALLEEIEKGQFVITSDGFAAIGRSHPDQAVTVEEIRNMWRGALKAGERRFFDLLVEAYPAGLTRDELAASAGHSLASSSIGVYLGVLKRNDLATQEGDRYYASADLVDEGAAA